MDNLIISGLDELLMTRLRTQATKYGRSMEEEALDILRVSLFQKTSTGESLVDPIRARGEGQRAEEWTLSFHHGMPIVQLPCSWHGGLRQPIRR